MTGRIWLRAVYAAAALSSIRCQGGTLDAGGYVSHGPLPVDERNPVIIADDSATDNWMGEYAVLLANSGGPPLAGIIVSPSTYWPNVDSNVSDWNQLIAAARSSGLRNIPDVTASSGDPLVRPADGTIESTLPNRSAGARLIVEASSRLSMPGRPLVVASGTRLTEIADAYLIDPTVADRIVVVASLGTGGDSGAMVGPNGDLDPWADWIVSQRFQYVQVSGYYDQTTDVTDSLVSSLPANPLGSWMAAKLPKLWKTPVAADQITVLALGVNRFVTDVRRVEADSTAAFDSMEGPPLLPKIDGPAWLVSSCAGPLAASTLWQMLLDPATYAR